MAIMFPIPLYRFFSEKEHALAMLKGEIFFNKISAFHELEDMKFRDKSERSHLFKTVNKTTNQDSRSVSVVHRRRKISDAWAFCATTSSASAAKKKYCIGVTNFTSFINQIDNALKVKFGQDLVVLFGPVAYNSKEADVFSTIQHPPYFTKSENKMADLEFRIVIIPPSNTKDEDIRSMIITIPNPDLVFEEALIMSSEINKKSD